MNNFSDEDQAAIAGLTAGGSQARGEFFDNQRAELKLLARFRINRLLARRVDESDILQEAFLEYCDRLPRYLEEPQLPPTVWLRRLVRQVISRQNRVHVEAKCRDVRRENYVVSSCCVNLDHLSASLTSMGTRMVNQEANAALVAAVESMTPIEREILTLVHFENKTVREAALEIGINVEAAKKRHRRALKRLKTLHEQKVEHSAV